MSLVIHHDILIITVNIMFIVHRHPSGVLLPLGSLFCLSCSFQLHAQISQHEENFDLDATLCSSRQFETLVCKAWPCLFWPQAQTSPMLVTAKLWNQPGTRRSDERICSARLHCFFCVIVRRFAALRSALKATQLAKVKTGCIFSQYSFRFHHEPACRDVLDTGQRNLHGLQTRLDPGFCLSCLHTTHVLEGLLPARITTRDPSCEWNLEALR